LGQAEPKGEGGARSEKGLVFDCDWGNDKRDLCRVCFSGKHTRR